MVTTSETKEWKNHKGHLEESVNGFDVIDCERCGFRHIIPVPTEEELEKAYQHDYYTQEKPLYKRSTTSYSLMSSQLSLIP